MNTPTVVGNPIPPKTTIREEGVYLLFHLAPGIDGIVLQATEGGRAATTVASLEGTRHVKLGRQGLVGTATATSCS